MTKKEAVKEIEKAFEPAFANYIITALTEGATVSDKEPFKPMIEIDLYSVIKQKYIEREVLDKIRAEIIELRSKQNVGVLECLDIIDKYKAESEDTEMITFSESQQKIVDALEAVNSAHWIDNHNGTISCSSCQTWFHKDDRYSYMHYCPNCKIKMKEGEE